MIHLYQSLRSLFERLGLGFQNGFYHVELLAFRHVLLVGRMPKVASQITK